MSAPAPSDRSLLDSLQRNGFEFVEAEAMRGLLLQAGGLSDWDGFAASWDALEPDTYLAQVGRQRRRRHAVYSAGTDGMVVREAHQPHYQSSNYNALQGDIERWFAPITDPIGASVCLQTILRFSRDLFAQLAPATRRWLIEVHQFRIEARADAPGEPTPEGVHRDGVDYVLVLLIDRQHIASGTTTIHTADGMLLGSFTLTHALDAAVVDDARVFHGVTPVTPLDPAMPSHRDVLVVTLRGAD
jgi:hypothetical protein